MLRGNRVVAEQLHNLAINDGVDVSGGELAELLLRLSTLKLRIIFSAALLVLREGHMQLTSDLGLAIKYVFGRNLFLILKLRRPVECVLPHTEHDLLEPLHLFVAESVLLPCSVAWRLLMLVGVEERLCALVIILFLI